MFSLVMAGNDTDWDVPVEEEHFGTFPLYRFLEYTDPSIVTRFEPITATTLEYLKDLPTLFMSEIHRDDDDNEFIRIRLGRVFDLSVVEREIHFKFMLSHNFGECPVLDRRSFRRVLTMDDFELHRTHWAIKSAELGSILKHIVPNAPGTLESTPKAEPPKPLKSNEGVVSTLQEFMALVLELEENAGEEIFYRGHSDSRYLLAPSLLRRNKDGAYKYLPKEVTMVRELLSVQDAQFSNDRSMLDKLVRMQHFGLPTRLLDVSSNPLVALYFCCSETKTDSDGNELEGEVVILRSPTNDVLHFDSDRVSCIANLCLMTDDG
ncbi:FRG domain-containing protein [Paracoccus sp. R12_1]|uniref:FRG domain-containing protein n=1 Tax=unclassified Paracoccus (in: a-proteobacteria) TaxID=2688777 RepID=UPI001ADBB6A9|nr:MULTISPECIES: FRG domain-containing protein [unclassified Paracoccus (in: a-proteobacteria)]MBO9457082.1 FRG domain-containing protein [Paracoccus sp. R12_2]MBO9488335.1 FRG domain-containing protein [Paracoccus sp. R12_1]